MKTISLIQKVVILTLTGLSAHSLNACSAGWIGGTSNLWSDPTNWNPNCVPSVSGDSAAFNMNSNNLNPTITTETISTLAFNTGLVSYNLSGTGPLNLTGTGASIQVLAGTHQISTTVDALASLSMNLIGNLNYTGTSFTSGAGTTVTLNGTGGQFSTNANFTPANLTINGGTMNAPLSFGSPASFIINGGTFNGYTNGAGVTNLVINGGLYNATGSTEATERLNSFTLNGGTFQSEMVVYSATPFATTITINGGTFNVNSSTALNGLIQAGNAITINGGSILLNAGGLTSLGSYSITGGTVLVENGVLGGVSTLQMSGGTVQTSIISNLTFSNINVSGGKLTNDGIATGAVSLTGGTIRGLGIFNNSFTNSGGVVEPGDLLPGPLTINDAYIQSSGGTLQIDLLNAETFGSLQAASAQLSGTLTLSALPGFTLTPTTVFPVVVTDPGALSGTFSKISEINFPSSLIPSITYTTDSVLVSVVRTVPSFIAIKELVISNLNQLNYLLFSRLERLVDPCSSCGRWDGYIGPLGSVGSVHSKEQTTGYDFYTAGALLGGDYIGRCFGFGAELDYQRLHGGGYNHFGNFDLDQLHGSIYGTMQLFNHLYLGAIIGGGYQWDGLTRTTGFSQDLHAKSSPNARVFDALGSMEFHWSCQYANASPFITVQYIYFHLDAFRESSADLFNLNFRKQKFESTRVSVGLKLDQTYCIQGFEVTPSVNAAWQRDLNDREHAVFFVNENPGFVPSGLLIPKFAADTILAGAGLEMALNECYSFELNYEYEGNNRLSDHFFYLGLNASF